jgi:hypothetical protein
VNPEQRLAREGPMHAVAQEYVERTDAQRPERQPPDVLLCERPLDLRRLRAVRVPPRQQQEHPAPIEPPQRERELVGRRRIEPLEIVDRDDQRPVLGEHLEGIANGEPERARIHGFRSRVLQQERGLEGAPPRRRQPRQHVVEHTLEQIPQACVREAALSLGRSRDENPRSALARTLDACKPERRLPDSRLPLEHERSGAHACSVNKGADRSEFPIPADNLVRHRVQTDGGRGRGKTRSSWVEGAQRMGVSGTKARAQRRGDRSLLPGERSTHEPWRPRARAGGISRPPRHA